MTPPDQDWRSPSSPDGVSIPPKTTLRRMWINQPSTLNPHHDLHGTNVLAQLEYGHTYRVYFLSGDVVSQQLPQQALSEGWRPVHRVSQTPISSEVGEAAAESAQAAQRERQRT